MNPALKKLIEARNKLVADAGAQLERFEGDVAPADVIETVERMHVEIGDFNKQIGLFERHAQLAAEAREFDQAPAGTVAGRALLTEDLETRASTDINDIPAKRRRLNAALKRCAVFGLDALPRSDRQILNLGTRSFAPDSSFFEGLEREERAALSGLDSLSGVTIPNTAWGGLVEAMKEFGTLRDMGAMVEETTFKDAVPYSTSDSTSIEVEILLEGQPATLANDTEIGTEMIGCFDFSSKIRTLSEQRLKDPAFDFLGWLTEICVQANERSLQKYLGVGDGVKKPLGFTKKVSVGRTAASQNAVTYDDMMALFHSVQEAYRKRKSSSFALQDTSLLALRLIKGTDGHPLFQTNMREGQPELLLGKPYHNLEDLDPVGAGKKPIYFGDWSSIKIRDGVESLGPALVTFKERFAERRMRGILLFTTAGGGYVNVGQPIKCLKMAD